jgi:uncharacterized protein (TIGR00369 family)
MADVEQNTQRTRTFSWEDPMVGANAAPNLSGIEYITAIVNGEIPAPPIAILMNIRISEIERGRVVFEGYPQEYHYNPIGSVHGGFAATICDSALGCCIHTMLPKGTGYTTLELSVNYLRPITTNIQTVYCEGKVIHVGRQIATAEARLTDSEGKLYAHAKTTCAVFTP